MEKSSWLKSSLVLAEIKHALLNPETNMPEAAREAWKSKLNEAEASHLYRSPLPQPCNVEDQAPTLFGFKRDEPMTPCDQKELEMNGLLYVAPQIEKNLKHRLCDFHQFFAMEDARDELLLGELLQLPCRIAERKAAMAASKLALEREKTQVSHAKLKYIQIACNTAKEMIALLRSKEAQCRADEEGSHPKQANSI